MDEMNWISIKLFSLTIFLPWRHSKTVQLRYNSYVTWRYSFEAVCDRVPENGWKLLRSQQKWLLQRPHIPSCDQRLHDTNWWSDRHRDWRWINLGWWLQGWIPSIVASRSTVHTFNGKRWSKHKRKPVLYHSLAYGKWTRAFQIKAQRQTNSNFFNHFIYTAMVGQQAHGVWSCCERHGSLPEHLQFQNKSKNR